jgi:hypothetical protein
LGIPTYNNEKVYSKEKLVDLADNAYKLKLLPSLDKENRDELIAKKHHQDNIHLPLITNLKTGWTKNLTHAPYILYPDIYNYLINKRGYDLNGLKAYKSLTAYKLLTDGHVEDLQINPQGRFVFIKWKVKPTQRSILKRICLFTSLPENASFPCPPAILLTATIASRKTTI